MEMNKSLTNQFTWRCYNIARVRQAYKTDCQENYDDPWEITAEMNVF